MTIVHCSPTDLDAIRRQAQFIRRLVRDDFGCKYFHSPHCLNFHSCIWKAFKRKECFHRVSFLVVATITVSAINAFSSLVIIDAIGYLSLLTMAMHCLNDSTFPEYIVPWTLGNFLHTTAIDKPSVFDMFRPLMFDDLMLVLSFRFVT